ncbi:PD-(D/E)XK nuclease family protein [Promicromonospora sp. MEB111]|uniref:PD-(D/E)XK nuclease family protein n=1 Tax=Promicromonospora sp. MEB111 TaxID=3040301 RepID=UPI00254A83CD|nr:PD-(D/E)XK nuclease family protein [Promicromonospora sp. MEB111]
MNAGHGSDDGTCARFLQAKTRVNEKVGQRPRRRKERQSSSLIPAVFGVLDQIEGKERPWPGDLPALAAGQGTFGPAEIAWITNAVTTYPDLVAEGLHPLSGHWVKSGTSPADLRELYAWGRGYTDSTGSLRVLVLPVMSTVSARPPARSKVAIAAFTTAFGTLSSWPSPWSERFRPIDSPGPSPTRVSIRQVGLLDGSMVELFDGTPDKARALYQEAGRPVAVQVATGGPASPGRDCVSCKSLDSCDGVPRSSGIVGVSAPGAPLRQVSGTTLRYHVACPRQARLSAIHLSSDAQESAPIEVGRVVDDVLNRAHGTGDPAACTADQLVTSLQATPTAPAIADRALKLLGHHAEICPRASGCEITEVQVQATVVAFDPAASSVVVARPDLLYREDGDLVWRETATSLFPPSGKKHLFDTHKRLQLALAVLLCHAGALGEPVARLEVEYLTDRGPDLRYLDVTDPLLLAQAHAVVGPVAQNWRHDEAFAPAPGPACGSCAYTRWCPDAAANERTEHA